MDDEELENLTSLLDFSRRDFVGALFVSGRCRELLFRDQAENPVAVAELLIKALRLLERWAKNVEAAA